MRKALSFIAWLVFVFLLLQLAGFVYFKLVVSKPISGYGYPTGLFVEHPDLGYVCRPGFEGLFKGVAYQYVPIRINAHGFRDRPFTPKQPGGFRLLVLGDSVVFGAGVGAQSRFTECLATRAPLRKLAAEVLNLGVSAYSIGHYVALARADYLDLAPDAVLVGITLNDLSDWETAGPARRLRRHREEMAKPVWFARIQERLDRTYAARFLSEFKTRFTYALMNVDEKEAYHTKWMRSVVEAWRSEANRARFSAGMDAFAAAQVGGVRYGFVIFPELNGLTDAETFREPRLTVRRELAQRGFQYCDPYAMFAAYPDPASLFLPRDGVHYTERGHALLCEALVQCMADGDLRLAER